jgi:hypothetical protein
MNKTRLRGLVLLSLGAILTVVIIAIGNLFFGAGNWHFVAYGFAIPGAMALVGLVQLLCGIPFGELARSWDSLAGWQRGILGTLFVLIACSVILGGLMLFVSIMYD